MNPLIKIPSKATLKKYGLSEQDYLDILKRQGEVCPVCEQFPSTGRFYIDHYHQRHYKILPDNLKRLYVRGLLCYMCNRFYVAKGITIDKSRNVTKYLEDFEKRRPK